MPLTPKRELTEQSLAARRANGRKSRGAVTDSGKARAATANLRHGFYAKDRAKAMVALGEDPKEYARLLSSLENDLSKGLEGALVEHMAHALSQMQHAERMQNGLAVQRLNSGLKMADLGAGIRLTETHNNYERLTILGRALRQPDFFPTPTGVEAYIDGFGASAPDNIKKLFAPLRALAKMMKPRPINPDPDAEPIQLSEEEQRAHTALQRLDAAVSELMMAYDRSYQNLMAECDKVRAPENIAALMAPHTESDLLMQKVDDSNLRQLWRLTSVLCRLRNGALTLTDVESDEPNLAPRRPKGRRGNRDRGVSA
jgi:hypothetical protein